MKWKIVAVAALALALHLEHGMAAGVYAIGGAGEAELSVAPTPTFPAAEDHSKTYQIGIGVQLNKWFAVEGMYHKFTPVKYEAECTTSAAPPVAAIKAESPKVTTTTSCTGGYEVEPEAATLSAVLGKDIGPVRPFVRAGVLYDTVENGTSGIYGAGLDWYVLRLEYQHVNSLTTGRDDYSNSAQMVMLSFTTREFLK